MRIRFRAGRSTKRRAAIAASVSLAVAVIAPLVAPSAGAVITNAGDVTVSMHLSVFTPSFTVAGMSTMGTGYATVRQNGQIEIPQSSLSFQPVEVQMNLPDPSIGPSSGGSGATSPAIVSVQAVATSAFSGGLDPGDRLGVPRGQRATALVVVDDDEQLLGRTVPGGHAHQRAGLDPLLERHRIGLDGRSEPGDQRGRQRRIRLRRRRERNQQRTFVANHHNDHNHPPGPVRAGSGPDTRPARAFGRVGAHVHTGAPRRRAAAGGAAQPEPDDDAHDAPHRDPADDRRDVTAAARRRLRPATDASSASGSRRTTRATR